MHANQAKLPLQTMARTLEVSTSGYYDWVGRAPSAREAANASLIEQMRCIHASSDATYGAPRMHAQLRAQGQAASYKRVERLMREQGLRGISRRRAYVVTTKRDKAAKAAPDLVKRQFTADAPNQLWVADMTYLPTWQGVLYLAVVLDVYSRKVIGWAFGANQTANLVIYALNMALLTRRPESVIHHSDQGSQYTSVAFGQRCKDMGVQPSMGTVGDAYDNAMAESFFASLECELIDRRTWESRTQARHEVFTWIEAWYNPHRLHSALGYKSPNNFEKEMNEKPITKHTQQQEPTQLESKDSEPSKASVTAFGDGLPTGCFAPVHNPSLATLREPPGYEQASPVDKPAPELATSINYSP
jgi:putative transposase